MVSWRKGGEKNEEYQEVFGGDMRTCAIGRTARWLLKPGFFVGSIVVGIVGTAAIDYEALLSEIATDAILSAYKNKA